MVKFLRVNILVYLVFWLTGPFRLGFPRLTGTPSGLLVNWKSLLDLVNGIEIADEAVEIESVAYYELIRNLPSHIVGLGIVVL